MSVRLWKIVSMNCHAAGARIVMVRNDAGNALVCSMDLTLGEAQGLVLNQELELHLIPGAILPEAREAPAAPDGDGGKETLQ